MLARRRSDGTIFRSFSDLRYRSLPGIFFFFTRQNLQRALRVVWTHRVFITRSRHADALRNARDPVGRGPFVRRAIKTEFFDRRPTYAYKRARRCCRYERERPRKSRSEHHGFTLYLYYSRALRRRVRVFIALTLFRNRFSVTARPRRSYLLASRNNPRPPT